MTQHQFFYTEALRWGFPGKFSVDERAEEQAATVRNFERGELAYKQYHEYGYVVSLGDAIEQAGFMLFSFIGFCSF